MREEFLEIEHKFLIDQSFNLQAFLDKLSALGPKHRTQVTVADRYYLSNRIPGFVYRHRFDPELQQLTLKSLETSAQIRTEINLDLGHHRGNQVEVVEAFLGVLDIFFSAEIIKDIQVFHYPKVEAVYYEASYQGKRLTCVEFEATDYESVQEAVKNLKEFEESIGFQQSEAVHDTLFELLVLPNLPETTRSKVERWMRS